MGNQTESGIPWTDLTWNPIRGCRSVSEGCRNCYAERQAIRQAGPGGNYEGLVMSTPDGPKWTGKIRTVPEKLDEPLRMRKPRRIFVNSMSDLFHEDVPTEFIARVFGVMAAAREHTFQVLTKRPFEMGTILNDEEFPDLVETFCAEHSHNVPIEWPLPNVHLGVSVEDQKTADERIPLLLQTPAAVRWISAEPLLGPTDLNNYLYTRFMMGGARHMYSRLDWVVVGGESGHGARPCNIEWVRSIVSQCKAAAVPAFVKQLGTVPVMGVFSSWRALVDSRRTAPIFSARRNTPELNSKGLVRLALSDRKGGNTEEWPEDLRIRQFPGEAR